MECATRPPTQKYAVVGFGSPHIKQGAPRLNLENPSPAFTTTGGSSGSSPVATRFRILALSWALVIASSRLRAGRSPPPRGSCPPGLPRRLAPPRALDGARG